MLPDKKAAAVKFLGDISNMDPKALSDLIVGEAGPELAEFFVSYCSSVFAQSPDKALQSASSLMLMGYLIRANEQRIGAPQA